MAHPIDFFAIKVEQKIHNLDVSLKDKANLLYSNFCVAQDLKFLHQLSEKKESIDFCLQISSFRDFIEDEDAFLAINLWDEVLAEKVLTKKYLNAIWNLKFNKKSNHYFVKDFLKTFQPKSDLDFLFLELINSFDYTIHNHPILTNFEDGTYYFLEFKIYIDTYKNSEKIAYFTSFPTTYFSSMYIM